MNAHKGMSVQPKVPDKLTPADSPVETVTQKGKPDLNVGDTYKGFPIIGVTKELYVCRHKSGYVETFQKKDRRLGLNESLYDSDFDNVMLEER